MSDFFISKYQSLENYLREIGEVQLLTPAEEIELAQKIKLNDQGALKRLVSANLRFVVSVAKLLSGGFLSHKQYARPRALHSSRALKGFVPVLSSARACPVSA